MKLKTKRSYMLSTCVVVVTVLILTAPAKTQGNLLPENDTETSSGKNDSDSDQLLMPVGM